MAYQSGSVSSHDNLLQTLAAFAVTNGFTQNMNQVDGDGYRVHLSRGDCYANFRSTLLNGYPSLPQTGATKVRASTGYSGASAWDAQPGDSGVEAYVGATYSESGQLVFNYTTADFSFPCPYNLFYSTSPDVVVMVVEFQPGMFQWIMFGEIVKYGTYVGGGFVSASCSTMYIGSNNSDPTGFGTIGGDSSVRNFAPFHYQIGGYYDGDSYVNSNSVVHAEVDGFTWGMPGYHNSTLRCHSNVYCYPLNDRSPNTFNALGVMTPYWLFVPNGLHWTPIGVLEHVRQLRVDYFSPGDIFTLGADRWMVFPYFQKFGYTLEYGWAIKYDGP